MSEKLCYLCQLPMLERDCENIDKNKYTHMHEEHIIQNGIGGRLRSEDILCEICGNELNEKVDSKFVKIFNLFDASLKLSKDRNKQSGKNFVIKADMIEGGITDVSIDNFEYRPKKPFFIVEDQNKSVKVYGPDQKTIKSFSKRKEVIEYIEKGYLLEKKTNVSDLILKFKYDFKYDDAIFFKGLTKIALEYALNCGIEIEHLKHLIDKINKDIVISKKIFSYYPIENNEKIYEIERFKSDDYYPIHMLKLYGDGSKLYCYIELFSTFQFYVSLNENYKNKITRSYVQQCTEKIIDPLFAQKIDYDMISYYKEKYEVNSNDIDQVLKKIQSAYEKESYQIDESVLSDKMYHIYSSFSHQSLISKNNPNITSLPPFEFLNDKGNKAKERLNFKNETGDIESMFDMYRKVVDMENASWQHFRIGSKNATYRNIKSIMKERVDDYFKYKVVELASYCFNDKEIEIDINR
ncbi:HNH endonuclease [Pectobacterium punjabense]|uniref:HNH endonuclease n=1 Tax=Pectobacterium punjabense TaxID=2108399 RepID=UPI00382CD01E